MYTKRSRYDIRTSSVCSISVMCTTYHLLNTGLFSEPLSTYNVPSPNVPRKRRSEPLVMLLYTVSKSIIKAISSPGILKALQSVLKKWL